MPLPDSTTQATTCASPRSVESLWLAASTPPTPPEGLSSASMADRATLEEVRAAYLSRERVVYVVAPDVVAPLTAADAAKGAAYPDDAVALPSAAL